MTATQEAHYQECLANGCSPRLAEMLACAQPPQAQTDREFLEGRCNGNDFEKMPALGDLYRRRAASAGVDVTGKVYLPGLAEFPGDPEAWVSGRGDVQDVCERKGLGCPQLHIKPQVSEPAPEISVADDLVAEHAERRIEANPSLAERPRAEVLAETKAQIQPHWSKG